MFTDKYLVNYANRKLKAIPQVEGHVGSLKLQPLRGAYQIEDVRLEKTNAAARPAFIEVKSAGARISGAALLQRIVATRVWADGYTLHLNAGEWQREHQLAAEPDWSVWVERAKSLFPIRIDELSLRNGALRLSFPEAAPAAALSVDHIQLIGRNLTNRSRLRSENYARWELRADFMGAAPIQALLRTSLLSPSPSFDIKGHLKDLALPRLNEFLHAFANLDISHGTFAAKFELTLHEGRVTGFAEPVFTDLELARWDEGKPWSTLKKMRHGLLTRSIENLEDENQTLSMRIPFEGRLGGMKLDLASAIASVLNNAFLEALEPGLAHVMDRAEHGAVRDAAEPHPPAEQGPHP